MADQVDEAYRVSVFFSLKTNLVDDWCPVEIGAEETYCTIEQAMCFYDDVNLGWLMSGFASKNKMKAGRVFKIIEKLDSDGFFYDEILNCEEYMVLTDGSLRPKIFMKQSSIR